MKKLTRFILAIILTISVVSVSSVFAEEPTPTPSEETTPDTTETITDEGEQTPEETTILLSEEATTFINNVNTAEANKDNILNAAQEYVDAYVASFDAEGEEATAAADALIVEKEEAFFNLFDQGALLDAYDALSDEEKNNEDVVNAKALLDALVLSVNTIMNTEEPSNDPVTYSAGVTLGTGAPTTIDMSLVTGDVVIKSDGLYVNGSSEGETTINPDGYEFSGTSILASNRKITVEPNNNVTALLILNNLTMSSVTCIETTASNTTIQLIGTNSLTGNAQGGGAIIKSGVDNYSLTITGEGTLNATGSGTHAAAIGSRTGSYEGFSNLLITGGATVNAVAGLHMPAIGAACGANYAASTRPYNDRLTKNIVIDNATVVAHGGEACAGIGSGWAGPVDGITIRNGAQVTAYGGYNSPGIGSGGTKTGSTPVQYAPDVKNISIEGGTTHVWAYGDQATNMPGIGCGKDDVNHLVGTLTNVVASPNLPNWATYIKYGTSATNYKFTTSTDTNGVGQSLATPIRASREFATFLQAKKAANENVYYTEVYFGLPYDEFSTTDKANIGANNFSACTGSFTWADINATKTALLSLTKVGGYDQDGISLTTAVFTTNNAQIQAIYNANENKNTGNYPLTFTYSYVDANDNQPRTASVTVTIAFRDACTPTVNNYPNIAASNAIHPTGGLAFTKAELIGLTEGTANSYLGIDADLLTDITFTTAEVDAINNAKIANETGTFPLTYTYVTTSDGTTPVTLTKKVTVTLNDVGFTFSPKDAAHPEKGQDMGPQFGANHHISKTGGSAFTPEQIKIVSSVSAKDSNGTSLPLTDITPDPTQLAAINAAKVAGQVGDFPLNYTFNDIDATLRTITVTIYLRDEGVDGTTKTPSTTVRKDPNDANSPIIRYEISGYQTGSNNYATPTGGAGWTDTEIKNLLDVVGDTAKGAKIDLTDFTVDPANLATLNAEKLAGKCGRYPVKFTGPNGENVTSYVTLSGCPVPGPFLVTYLDCYGNTVKIEWVSYGGSSSAPNGNFSGVSNVTAHIEVKQNNCGINTGYRVPNTAEK